MKNVVLLCLLALAVGFTACKSDSASTAENNVTTLNEKKPLPNANQNTAKPVADVIPADTVNVAKLTFTEEVYDYGTVKEGESVEHTFKFKNTGVAPLIIESAKSTCGCTVPQFPKEPIAPGESGEIAVKFNSKNKSGRQRKPVNVTANTWPKLTTVYIDGTVEKSADAATATNK